jgi:hypothetical protein
MPPGLANAAAFRAGGPQSPPLNPLEVRVPLGLYFIIVPDPGCLSRIPNFFNPGFASTNSNTGILKQKKLFLSSRKYDPGCSSRIRIPDPDPVIYLSRIPDPGVKKAPDPGSGSATLVYYIIFPDP